MRGPVASGALILCILSLALRVDGSACGDKYTQVTLCFPGGRAAANCQFVVANYAGLSTVLRPCPSAALFGKNCTTLPGILNLAYGPCRQANDELFFPNATFQSPADATKPLKPILKWLDLLGLQQITEVGALLVRGYAFQLGPLPSISGLAVMPGLTKIGTLIPNSLETSQPAPLTILGASVPQLPLVTQLGDGMLIQNTPNVNFSSNFPALEEVSGPIVIVGNQQLTSLDGLQGLGANDVVGKLEILGNPRLQDISALEDALGCVGDRPTAVDSKAVLGAIEVIPEEAPSSTSCLINNAAQACEFITNSECPEGTYYDSRLPLASSRGL